MKRCFDIRKFFALFFFAFFISYYVSVNGFVHTHILNGVTIVHSHLHTERHHQNDTGGHNTSGITLIASLSQLQTIEPSFSLDDFSSPPAQYIDFGEKEVPNILFDIYSWSDLRAPPVL